MLKMETFIQTSTPHTNAAQKLLAILAGVFVVIVIGGILALQRHIPLPERVVVLAVVRGKTHLPEGIPIVWKRAIEHTYAPTLIGIAMVYGRPSPFALTMSRIMDPMIRIERSGLLTFVSDREIPRTSSMTLGAAFLLALRTLTSPAHLMIDLHALDERLRDRMQGPVDGLGIWKTNVQLPSKPYVELPLGDVAVDLETFPEAWPILAAVSRDAGFSFAFEDRPSRIGWTSASDSTPIVDLEWASPIATSTQFALAASAGFSTVAPYRLSDGVVVDELRLPSTLPTSSVILTDRRFATTLIENAHPIRACQDGRPVFRLANDALYKVLLLLGFHATKKIHYCRNIRIRTKNAYLRSIDTSYPQDVLFNKHITKCKFR